MPKPALKTSPRVKRAKAEIQQEFSAIQDEIQAARESADPKAEELARHRESEARQAVEGVRGGGGVEQISRTGPENSRALSGISEKPVGEVKPLPTFSSAAGPQRGEPERWHTLHA